LEDNGKRYQLINFRVVDNNVIWMADNKIWASPSASFDEKATVNDAKLSSF
jgi:hypothetical protein